jgi:hypothetical protein
MSADCILAARPGTVKRETRVSGGAATLLGTRRAPGQSVCLGRLMAGWWCSSRSRGGVRSQAFLNILLEIGEFGERLGDSFQW